MKLEATLELTPLQIWWLYETAHEQKAYERALFVSDVVAAAGAVASEAGFKNYREHMRRLSAAGPT